MGLMSKREQGIARPGHRFKVILVTRLILMLSELLQLASYMNSGSITFASSHITCLREQ
jgi:hypothetical protein